MVRRNNKGFTLIELLITVTIIGILAAISIPLYIGQQKKAAMSEAQTNLQNIRLLEEQVFADSGRYTPDIDTDITTLETSTYNITNDIATNPDCSLPLNAAKSQKIICILSRFRPGNARDLKYNYFIHVPAQVLTVGTCTSSGNDPNRPAAGSFTACAMPKGGTPVEGTSPFWINDRNQSNIQ